MLPYESAREQGETLLKFCQAIQIFNSQTLGVGGKAKISIMSACEILPCLSLEIAHKACDEIEVVAGIDEVLSEEECEVEVSQVSRREGM